MPFIITESCTDCKETACMEVCPVDCIYDIGDKQNYIHPEECIDCGLCLDACPVEAIFPEEEVPEKWDSYIAKNYTKFNLAPPN